jgi:ABC-type Zn uptake system ZnuABC Zn-binding protein ZnuA
LWVKQAMNAPFNEIQYHQAMNQMLVRIMALVLVAGGLCLAPSACTSMSRVNPGGRLSVVATSTQIQDFARNVGGERVTVVPILGPDEDAHTYQPTAADARNVAEAGVVLANGIGLEPWFDRVAQNARSRVPVVKVGEQSGIPVRTDEDEGGSDPHVWFDPTNSQRMVLAIRDALAAADPDGKDIYAANAASYNGQLVRLDADIKALWAAVPESQRRLVTNHDVFGYYVARYGLTFVGSILESLSTEAEPSAAELQRLVQEIRSQGVRAIFTESSINPRLAQQISQQAGVRIYSNLYGDALGKPGSDGDTYIKMMLFNTRTMIDGMTR